MSTAYGHMGNPVTQRGKLSSEQYSGSSDFLTSLLFCEFLK